MPKSDKDSVESNLKRVTRKSTHCLMCDTLLAGRQERFCHDRCRWDYHNNMRLSAKEDLLAMAYKVIETYEVKRKEG